MLAFGLRQAPKIFNTVADALEWCVASKGVINVLYHLDDYAVVELLDSGNCHEDLKQVCTELGGPGVPDKKEGPFKIAF